MKKRIVINNILGFIFLCLTVNVAFTQSPVIKGQVTDSQTDKPIVDAIIKYKHSDQDTYQGGALTDSLGNYTLYNRSLIGLLGTIVKMETSADGYYPKEIEIFLIERTNTVNVELNKIGIPITREFQIKHRDSKEIFELIQPYIHRQYGKASVSEKFRTIVVTDLPEQLEKIEQKILSYDIPLKNIWVEVKIIEATGNGQEEPTYSQEIEGIAKQLNALFKFSHYELVGHADAMGLEGSTLRFSIPVIAASTPPFLSNPVEIRLEYFDNVIRLNGLSMSNLTTTVNIPNGETVILGASRQRTPVEGSLITVVTAKVVE